MKLYNFEDFINEKWLAEDDTEADADTEKTDSAADTSEPPASSSAAPAGGAPPEGGGPAPDAAKPAAPPKKEEDDYDKLNKKLTEIVGDKFKPKKDDKGSEVYTVPLMKLNRHKIEQELEKKVGHAKNLSGIGSHGKRWAKDQHGVNIGLEVLMWEENGKAIIKVSKLMPSKIGGW